jgi:hypothetical protein
MVEHRRHLHPWERFAALLAAVVALAFNVAASVELFTPQSSFGYHLAYTSGNEVVKIDSRTDAERAGIVAGDRLDFTKSSLHDRIVGMDYQPALPGERIGFSLIHDERSRTVTLEAAPLTSSESRHALFSPLTSFLRLTGFAYIVVALIILVRRPNRMTWGLFLYLVSATNVTVYRFPDSLFPIAAFASDVLTVAGTIGLVIFAVRFPYDRPLGWRALIDRFAIPAGAIFAIPNVAWDVTSLYLGESPAMWMSYGSTFGALALIIVAGIALVTTYLTAQRWERQRLQWVIVGVFFTLLSYASSWARYWSAAYTLATSDAWVWISALLYACAPFAILYAVARQRVFEISFVVSRTLVFTIVTGAIFAVFALIEWLAGRVLERTGVTLALVGLAAICVAFYLSTVESKIEQFVERTLFRRRHRAEKHLAHICAGLPQAQNAKTVEEAMVREPIQAYALSSSALFVRDDSGDYRCDGVALDASVALRLQGARRAVRLHELDDDAAVESGNPVLAVPIFVRAHLEAIAVYGAHVNGEDIDPDEVDSLEAMGTAAGIAYDHLEAARVRQEAVRWRRMAERQARELAALRERNSRLGEHPAGDDARGDGPE